MKKTIERINELYKKQKTKGLTEEEKKEQAKLRRIYIDSIKSNLKQQLDNVKIVPQNGSLSEHKCNCDH